MNKTTYKWYTLFSKNAKTWACIAGFVAAVLLGTLVWQRYKIQYMHNQEHAKDVLELLTRNIRTSTRLSYGALTSLGYSVNPNGEIKGFEPIAQNILQEYSMVDAVQLVPDGIITHIYPLPGNEPALGYNILLDETRKPEALKAKASGDMYIAGPVDLKQGGIAAVARLPLYRGGKFWGFAALLIKMETLANEIGLNALANRNFSIRLSKQDTSIDHIPFVYPSNTAEVRAKQKHSLRRYIAEGDWVLELYYADAQLLGSTLALALLGLFFSAGIGFISFRLLNQPNLLHAKLNMQASTLSVERSRFALIFQQAPMGIAYVRFTDWQFIEFNEQLERILGYPAQTLENINLLTLIEPNDQAPFLQAAKNLQNTVDKETISCRFKHLNGQYRWLKIVMAPSTKTNAQHQHFVMMLDDITEQKQRESLLSQLNQKLYHYLENSPLGIVEYQKDLTVTRWSKQCENMFGWTESEILNLNIGAFNLIYHEDIPAATHVAEELMTGSVSGNISVNRNYTKWGDVKHCIWYNAVFKNEFGEAQSIMSLVQDVTQQKQTERERETTRKQLELIFNTSHDLMYLIAIEDNTFTYASINRAFEETVGIKRQKVIGQEVGKLLPTNNVTVLGEKCRELCKTNQKVQFEEKVHIPNRDLHVRTELTPIFNEEGVLTNILGVSHDITEEVRKERALNRSYQLTKNQNDRLLNFAYIVSHNLRTHTSNISGILRMLKASSTAEERNQLLEYLQTVANTLDETMHHLNEVVNIQTNLGIATSPLSLHDQIEKTRQLLREDIKAKKATIVNDVDEDVTVTFNKSYLESVLLNFLSNALKYSHPDKKPIVRLYTDHEENYTVLHIADNGLGIDMKKHGARLFGMYKRFHAGPEGKGLGLFITKNQIEALGGKIAIDSTVGVGTTFKVYFASAPQNQVVKD